MLQQLYESIDHDCQILSNGLSVWVNSSDGMCIGRFTPNGVDVHLDFEQQDRLGRECIDCFERTDDLDADWKRFTDGMKEYYDVEINNEHKPQISLPTRGCLRGMSISAPKSCGVSRG